MKCVTFIEDLRKPMFWASVIAVIFSTARFLACSTIWHNIWAWSPGEVPALVSILLFVYGLCNWEFFPTSRIFMGRVTLRSQSADIFSSRSARDAVKRSEKTA